jgi:hypothetical protein
MIPSDPLRVLVNPLADLLRPTEAEGGFEGEAIGFVEVEGHLAERFIGLSGH